MSAQLNTHQTAFINDKALSGLEKIFLSLAGSLVLIIASKISVPFWPVSATLQSLAVVGLGVVLGPRLGSAAVVAYLVQGAMGHPVFADAGSYPGLMMLAKPSAGFLLSFLPAAYLAGTLSEKGWSQSLTGLTGIFLLSNIVIYAAGMAWLSALIGVWPAVSNASMWMLGDLAKIGLGVASLYLFVQARSKKAQ